MCSRRTSRWLQFSAPPSIITTQHSLTREDHFMKRLLWIAALGAPLLAALALPGAEDKKPTADSPTNDTGITWKKTVIDKVFRSEGVAVADVNKDGKMDVIHAEAWYEAPDWKMHPIQKLGNYGDGLNGYSHSFCCWAGGPQRRRLAGSDCRRLPRRSVLLAGESQRRRGYVEEAPHLA